MVKRIACLALAACLATAALAQRDTLPYWNTQTQLIPWRPAPPLYRSTVVYTDLDKDGDPDLLGYTLTNGMPVLWIDDDDDMKPGQLEGDTDSDCLLIDRNRDGIHSGPRDLCIDWCDENRDGKADIQLIVSNGGLKNRIFYDWDADFMYIIDDDRDQIMHYIDWNLVSMLAWEHNGHANFYEDYSGNTSFLKMHGSSFRIHDLRLNWENPFLFFDTDGDKLTEGAIRFVNTPTFRPKENNDPLFNTMDTAVDIHFNGLMDYAAVTWDLDNDNGPGNEFDFDMSLLFRGRGFDYRDQVHRFKSLRGLGPQTDHLLYDARWRQLTELVYPDRDTAWHMIYNRGQWSECRLVFDEDDDCNRWERVEFYDPKDPFVIGREKGGLDHNQQADAAGDRGEFDLDCSGKGQLYVGAFDGRIHLYGAEWGAWRMDQTAYSYQGFGGIYNRWRPGRLQKEPEKFATVKYEDTDNNGFMDKLLYDLDGDKRYEDSVSLLALGLSDRQPLFGGQGLRPGADAQQRFAAVANGMWARAQQAVAIARQQGIETSWYNFYLQPHSLHEKYDFGYWLGFYLYRDLRDHFARHGNKHLLTLLDKAYYSGNWNLLKQKL